jgi:hypothetical protein
MNRFLPLLATHIPHFGYICTYGGGGRGGGALILDRCRACGGDGEVGMVGKCRCPPLADTPVARLTTSPSAALGKICFVAFLLLDFKEGVPGEIRTHFCRSTARRTNQLTTPHPPFNICTAEYTNETSITRTPIPRSLSPHLIQLLSADTNAGSDNDNSGFFLYAAFVVFSNSSKVLHSPFISQKYHAENGFS